MTGCRLSRTGLPTSLGQRMEVAPASARTISPPAAASIPRVPTPCTNSRRPNVLEPIFENYTPCSPDGFFGSSFLKSGLRKLSLHLLRCQDHTLRTHRCVRSRSHTRPAEQPSDCPAEASPEVSIST